MSYVPGAWNAICQRCGFSYKSTQLRKEWTGLRVCCGAGTNNCHETRHPQESVRGKPDRQSPPWVSPEPPDAEAQPITQDDL